MAVAKLVQDREIRIRSPRGARRPRVTRRATTSAPRSSSCAIVGANKNGTFTEERSVRRPPSAEEGGNGGQQQEADQDMVAAFDDPARNGWSDHRDPQWQGAYSGAGQREHGRAQARRVCDDPRVQEPWWRQESRRRGVSQVRTTAMEAKAILRTARISPQKARLVADQVRGMPV